MLYIPYINSYNEATRIKKVINFLEKELTKPDVEEILIQDPYLYPDLYKNKFYEIFIEHSKNYVINSLSSNLDDIPLWIQLFYKISDLNEKYENKNLKIISQISNNQEDKKIYIGSYKKITFYLLAKKYYPFNVHDRFILLKKSKNKFSGIHIGISLDKICSKDILFTKISNSISKDMLEKFEERFYQEVDKNE